MDSITSLYLGLKVDGIDPQTSLVSYWILSQYLRVFSYFPENLEVGDETG